MSLFPSRKQEAVDVYDGPAWGYEVRADTSRAGVVDDGNIAWPERVVEARRQWPQARSEDFEKTGKRTYVDRATGTEYLREHGAPVLSIGTPAVNGIIAFFVGHDGHMVFLRRADVPEGQRTYHGQIVEREVTPGLRRGPQIN